MIGIPIHAKLIIKVINIQFEYITPQQNNISKVKTTTFRNDLLAEKISFTTRLICQLFNCMRVHMYKMTQREDIKLLVVMILIYYDKST